MVRQDIVVTSRPMATPRTPQGHSFKTQPIPSIHQYFLVSEFDYDNVPSLEWSPWLSRVSGVRV